MAEQATQPVEPEVDAESGKFVYHYQPRNKEGEFIGKPYRFLYTDQMDLVRQLTEAKEHGDRFIYEVKSGKRQLKGDPATPAPSYQPAPESEEEAEKRRREEFRKTAEQEFGAPLDDVRANLKKARALDEYFIANTWAQQNEANGYYICPDNAKTMMKYLADNNLALTTKNLDLALEELKDTLVQKPQEQAKSADSTQQQPEATNGTPPVAKPRSTGIMPGQFGGSRTLSPTDKQPLTKERFRQIERMGRDEWKKLQRTNAKEADAFLTMKYGTAQPQQ